mgnify:CR=1 FL=1
MLVRGFLLGEGGEWGGGAYSALSNWSTDAMVMVGEVVGGVEGRFGAVEVDFVVVVEGSRFPDRQATKRILGKARRLVTQQPVVSSRATAYIRA